MNSYATGPVDGGDNVGGLVGWNFGVDEGIASIVNSYATGPVTGDNKVGGHIGLNEVDGGTASIVNSYATGAVRGVNKVGGLAGENSSNSSIVRSFATGDVTAVPLTGDEFGGLAGSNRGIITDSYARGDVDGSRDSGGLVGYAYGGSSIANSYATGVVTNVGNANVGNLVGDDGGGTVTDSFWDTTVDPAKSAGGTGKSTAEMTSLATFPNPRWLISGGWKPFEQGVAVWGICALANDGYPFLLWQFSADPCVAQVVTGGSSLVLSCEGPVAVGATVECTVSGGDPGIEILWRAAYNPPLAGAGVTLDAAGTGTFSFAVPAAALGEELTVELVEWLAPASLGVVGGPVPASVPAGEAPVVPVGLLALTLLASAGAALAVRRQVVAG